MISHNLSKLSKYYSNKNFCMFEMFSTLVTWAKVSTVNPRPTKGSAKAWYVPVRFPSWNQMWKQIKGWSSIGDRKCDKKVSRIIWMVPYGCCCCCGNLPWQTSGRCIKFLYQQHLRCNPQLYIPFLCRPLKRSSRFPDSHGLRGRQGDLRYRGISGRPRI